MNDRQKFLFIGISILLMCFMTVGCKKSRIAVDPRALPKKPNPQAVYTNPSDKLVSAKSSELSVAKSSDKQTTVVNHQTVSVWDFKLNLDTKQASVVVSFNKPSNADWTLEVLNGVKLKIGSESLSVDSGSPIENFIRSEKDGKLYKISFDNESAAGVVAEVSDPQEIPVRTDRIYFNLPDPILEKGIPGQTVTLIVDSLILLPFEGQECDADYLARAQARLDEVQKGIVLACAGGDFSQEIVVQQSPVGINSDAIITSVFPNGIFVDLNKIKGPWEFILQP